MPKIEEKFAELVARREKALILYFTAGDPSMEELPGIVAALEQGGADLIEIGIPFSDPIADGPTIQASDQRALDRGTTPLGVLEALRGATISVPIVLMGYYNPILRIGLKRFAERAAHAGISGTIVSDLTPEESDPWVYASRDYGLDNIFLAAPTSTDARLDEVCQRSSGFVYAVSRTGVTDARHAAPPEATELVARLKNRTDLPVCVGFGISKPEHVRMICEVADGAVIGSWLVDRLASGWDAGRGAEGLVSAIRQLKAATR